ncbi:DNA-binding response regulator [Xylanimonas oleitrophica]|uniref:DNA-binding response regulator n=1 Tax=Xylanimonas oleitrophica TaxID=2607479 RepID=A0A2W5WXS9_9MICO|nr:response regulator transcription factor [Xylanimonas oleitrophica]PZR52595.1 DNA-binding response regulator [Xylanimonas oleitrophica]
MSPGTSGPPATTPDAADRPAVAVVDDAAVFREAIGLLMPSLRVTRSAATAEELLRHRPQVDLVLLDLHLANGTQPGVRQGVAAVRALSRAGYRVCVYSQEERPFVLAACLAAGAVGMVPKSAPTARAERDFVEAARGGTVVPPTVAGLLDVLVRRGAITLLSERQRQVLHGRARGLSYGRLARELHTGESTLRGYWADITRALSLYLAESTPAEVEHALGLAPGDLLEVWPDDTDDWWRATPGTHAG